MSAIITFKLPDSEKQIYDLPTGPAAHMLDSGYINEELLLKLLEHFQGDTLGKCLLSLDGHMCHC
jgi:hypothetical protein